MRSSFFIPYGWILAAIVCASAGPTSVTLAWAFFAFTFGPEFVVLLWFLAAVAAAGFAMLAAVRRQWRWVAAAIPLPLSLALLPINSGALWWFTMSAGEELHFRVARAGYLRDIERIPTNRGPRLAVFVLSEDGFMGISNEHLAVYDESDEIMLPDQERSDAWKARAKETYLDYGIGQWRPMGDHFYIVRISF
jgi:hypothetical protein